MRKTVKVLHTVASGGLVGGLVAYMILLVASPVGTPEAMVQLRAEIAAVSNYLLLPSLGLALVSGLLSMIVHRPFLDQGWVWVKAGLGLLMFKGTLTIIGAKANYAATLTERIARGEAPADALNNILTLEWWTLVTVLAVAVANYVLGVWRPSFSRKKVRRLTPEEAAAKAAERAARAAPAAPAEAPAAAAAQPARELETQ